MSYQTTLNCGFMSCLCLLCKEDPITEEERYKTLIDNELLHVVSGYKLSDPKFIRNENDIPYCLYCVKRIDNQKQTLIECDKCHYYVGHYACFRKWKETNIRGTRCKRCKACGA
jgi:hypothetical protein